MLRYSLALVVVLTTVGCATASTPRVISTRVDDRLKSDTVRLVVLPTKCATDLTGKLVNRTFCDDGEAAQLDSRFQRVLERRGHVATLGRDVVASMMRQKGTDASLQAYATGLGIGLGEVAVREREGSTFMDTPPAVREQLVSDVGADGVAELSVDFEYDRLWGTLKTTMTARIGLGAFRSEPLAYVECEASGYPAGDESAIVDAALSCIDAELSGTAP